MSTSPSASASGLSAVSICRASSRVGARISARGRFGCRVDPLCDRRVNTGRAKAKVLPEPVRPRPRTSRPASESGSVAAWIGNGELTPSSASSRVRAAGTPSSAKLGPVAVSSTDASAGAVGVGRVSVMVLLAGCPLVWQQAQRQERRARSDSTVPPQSRDDSSTLGQPRARGAPPTREARRRRAQHGASGLIR